MLAVIVVGSDVSLFVQNPIHRGPAPLPAAISRRRRPIQRKLLGDLTYREALFHVGVEDPPYYGCLGFLYLCMRRHTITAGDFHQTERHIRRNNLSTTSPVELAPPVSFGNLRPLELGDCSRDLVHLLRKRIVRRPALEENCLHAESFQLIQD